MKLTDFLENLGSPVAFYPQITDITDSTTATLLLCQLIYWHAELRLTRYEQENARRVLVKAGFISEQRRGVPARLYFRVNLDAVNAAWEALYSSMGETHIQECVNSPSLNGTNQQPRVQTSSTLDRGYTPPLNGGNQPTITETTPETTVQRLATESVGDPPTPPCPAPAAPDVRTLPATKRIPALVDDVIRELQAAGAWIHERPDRVELFRKSQRKAGSWLLSTGGYSEAQIIACLHYFLTVHYPHWPRDRQSHWKWYPLNGVKEYVRWWEREGCPAA